MTDRFLEKFRIDEQHLVGLWDHGGVFHGDEVEKGDQAERRAVPTRITCFALLFAIAI